MPWRDSYVDNQTVFGAIYFHRLFFFILWKSVATSNCLITNILQNIFFYVQLKKEAGLEQHEVE